MSFQTFKTFVANATTRCGAAYEIKSVQTDFDGVITNVKGYVYLYNDKNETVAQDMLWNLKGKAVMIGEQFDLIKESAFDEVDEHAPTVLETQTISQ